jgi:Ca2+-binding EF-hand superfamily protein
MKNNVWLVALLAGAGIAMAEDKTQEQPKASPRGNFMGFESLDANGDGKITPEEFQAAQTKMTEARFARLDKNSDGVISKDEFPPAAPKDSPRARFMPDLAAMDKDGNGSVSKEEFLASTKEISAERFKKVDKNGDGAITKDEWDAVREAFRPGGQRGTPPAEGDKKPTT